MILLKADCSLDNVTNCTSQQLSGCVSNAGLGISPALQLESDFIVSWIISLFRRCRNTSSQIHWTQSQTNVLQRLHLTALRCHENSCITPSGRFLIAVEKRQLFVFILYCGLFSTTHTMLSSHICPGIMCCHVVV